jgi:hypothetical protein
VLYSRLAVDVPVASIREIFAGSRHTPVRSPG